MTNQRSCLYHGSVYHKRLKPFIHELNYRVFYLWLNLDDIPALANNTRWFSYNRFNLFSFYDRDHASRDGTPIRPWIEKALKEKGYDDCLGGEIYVLCYPRILGYVFNPLTMFFCYDKKGTLRTILHEVKNTFGDQHGYLLPVEKDENGLIQQSCDKIFHVSPFIQMDAAYAFKIREPDDKLAVTITQDIDEENFLIATLMGKKDTLSSARLLKSFFKYPLMTVKVIFAIHYEAFHLWRKGATFYKRPTPPKNDVS